MELSGNSMFLSVSQEVGKPIRIDSPNRLTKIWKLRKTSL